MKQLRLLLLAIILPATALAADTSKPVEKSTRADAMLADYFRAETAALAGRCLADIHTLSDWTARRGEYRRQLQEMLGLWPWPERTDLKPLVTGKIERDDFSVEKVAFQASPGLYVTANLFLPRPLTNRPPAILYASGHKTMVVKGVSLGNKTGYQHHGEWFARNGYVCLVTDTLSLGEIRGVHRGTYAERMWWWNSRGYTPAGVEAWFNIRALDYLCSRPEVDKERIGMTGRSGGGSYTWTVAALDDRVKVAVPVAGITDLQNQVVDGALEGHCDCMFFVNTYRWDFPLVAALLAPRPLLIGNSDKDRLFPLDGVVRLYEKTRRIYGLYGATNQLGLLITEGPHEDTQEIRLPVFAWFNRFLKGQKPLIEMAAKPLLPPAELKVFETLPADAVNKTVQETFVPAAKHAATESTSQPDAQLAALKEKCFGGWLVTAVPASASQVRAARKDGVRLRVFDFSSQPFVPLRLYVFESTKTHPRGAVLSALDAAGWTNWFAAARTRFAAELLEESPTTPTTREANTTAWDNLKRELESSKAALVFVAPRGIGPTAWSGPEKRQTQIRRRFMLLGQTLDGMRVWDLRRAVQALRSIPQFKTTPLTLRARGEMGVNLLYAALFEPGVARLELSALPTSHRQGPDYLNVLKVLDIPQALQLASQKLDLRSDSFHNYTLAYDTPTDPALQARLDALDATLRAKYGMKPEQTAVGVLDLIHLRLAMVHPDRGEYAASVAKIGILLAYFQLHPAAATNLDSTTRHELGLMAKISSNEMAAKYSHEIGLPQIQQVLNAYHFYDTNHGGGLWMGKHYGQGSERIGDPIGNNSHAATVRQLLRFYLLLEQGKLVSPEASKTMREIFASPDIPHDHIKFVKGLAGRDVQIIRKWGSWEDWFHDSALVTGPGRHYIIVALTHHPKGDEYLVDLAAAVDDWMTEGR